MPSRRQSSAMLSSPRKPSSTMRQGRGSTRELTACLRTGRAPCLPRARVQGRSMSFVTPKAMISERPAEAADRAVPGHWEGDPILGLGSSAIGTLVERTTRFTMLLHLPRMAGHGEGPRVKNGPALAGHGAEAVRDAIARTIATLPRQLRRSLTWYEGAEMAKHDELLVMTGLSIYFCDPHSPGQRGSKENTNGLLRQSVPNGTDLAAQGADDLAAVAHALNARPRKTLGWRTPAEARDEILRRAPKGPRCDGRLRPPPVSNSDRWVGAASRHSPPRPPAGASATGGGSVRAAPRSRQPATLGAGP